MGVMVAERASGNFSGNDQRVLTTIARQTAIAIENARLFDQLERKVENLKILNEVGQKLTRGLAKGEKEILDLIYESATSIGIDTHNWYIAFYDPNPNKPDTEKEIYGNIRFPLGFDEGKKVIIPERQARNGLTEYVIRTKQSFNPPDVKKVYEDFARDQIDKIPFSWLGVPMMSEGQVFGVIVLRNNKRNQAYSPDEQEILEILAGQAAVAIQNSRLYQSIREEQEKRLAAENMAIMSSVAAEFAHKMNNLAGTIPVRISIAEANLNFDDPKDANVVEQLNKIKSEADGILKAAKEIRKSSEPGVKENFQVNELIEIAIGRAMNTHKNIHSSVEFQRNFAEDLPLIYADRNRFIDTLTSILRNGIEALDKQGMVSVQTRCHKVGGEDIVEIEISDSGKGIGPTELPKIFELFYTTKESEGLGFGLWRDKIFIKGLGGKLDVKSELGAGSTFTIRIPVSINSGGEAV
jgi:K+-sensing histidine kinase KdpD